MYNSDFNSKDDFLRIFPNNMVCFYHLEKIRWNNNVISPFDPLSKVYKCKKNNYKCKNTGKYFNVKTGTIFDNTKIPLQKWFLAIWLINSKENTIKASELSKELGISTKTASAILKRLNNHFNSKTWI